MATPRNAHTAVQREFIVRKLAAFEPPRAIVAAFVAVFPGAACNENDVLATDPETTIVSPELYQTFRAERERVILDPKSAPYADQAARLIALSNQARFYAGNNQLAEQRLVLRQIAEEQGVIGNKGPKPVAADAATANKITAIRHIIVDPAKPAEPDADAE